MIRLSPPPGYYIERFDKAVHSRSGFCCGLLQVDNYLHQQAGQAQSKNLATTHVLLQTGRAAPIPIVGFATLTPVTIPLIDAPQELRNVTKKPHLQAQLLAQMGVDKQYQGNSLGRFLVKNSLVQCYEISRVSAFPLVIVDAATADLVGFYVKLGFTPLPENPQRLFLSMATLEKAMTSQAKGGDG